MYIFLQLSKSVGDGFLGFAWPNSASNQFALPVLSYLVWTRQWPIKDLQEIDREAWQKVENGGGVP